MRHLILPAVLITMSLVSCTSAYKTGQTPDDVYYSPNPVHIYDNDSIKEDYSQQNYRNNNNGRQRNDQSVRWSRYDQVNNNYTYDCSCQCYRNNQYGYIYTPNYNYGTVYTPAKPKAPNRYVVVDNNGSGYNNTNNTTQTKGRIIKVNSNYNYGNTSSNSSSNSNSGAVRSFDKTTYTPSSSSNNNSHSNSSSSGSGTKPSSSSNSGSSGGSAPVRSFPKGGGN